MAVTGCPTGIAHTYMAAESLSKAAEKLGVSIKVETRGASGVENRLTEEEIREAHAVILSSDVDAEEDRFQGKTVIRSSLGDAIKNAERLIEEALSKPAASYEDRVKAVKKEREQKRSGPYKHLMNGVSFMIPLVVAGGLYDCAVLHLRHPRGGGGRVPCRQSDEDRRREAFARWFRSSRDTSPIPSRTRRLAPGWSEGCWPPAPVPVFWEELSPDFWRDMWQSG